MPYDSNGNASLVPSYKATSGETIRTEQHNPPLEDIANMLSQVLLRSGVAPMGGALNMNGFPLLNMPDGADPSSPVTKSQLDAAIASLANAAPTGAVQAFRRKTPPAGWIKENGGTIGNASSGATTRANADTQALFTLYWSEFSNTELPIFTNTGAASTRGSSAAADYAAGKRMSIHDSQKRFFRGSDEDLTVGLAQADEIKSHTHGITDPGHSHLYTAFGSRGNAGGGSDILLAWAGSAQFNTTSALTGITIQATGGSETRPLSSVVLYCVKL